MIIGVSYHLLVNNPLHIYQMTLCSQSYAVKSPLLHDSSLLNKNWLEHLFLRHISFIMSIVLTCFFVILDNRYRNLGLHCKSSFIINIYSSSMQICDLHNLSNSYWHRAVRWLPKTSDLAFKQPRVSPVLTRLLRAITVHLITRSMKQQNMCDMKEVEIPCLGSNTAVTNTLGALICKWYWQPSEHQYFDFKLFGNC